MITKIESIDDVRNFFKQLLNEDLNFHPDTPFEDYIDLQTKKPCFSKEEAEMRNKLMDDCFVVCEQDGVDIYEIAMEEFWSSINNSRLNNL